MHRNQCLCFVRNRRLQASHISFPFQGIQSRVHRSLSWRWHRCTCRCPLSLSKRRRLQRRHRRHVCVSRHHLRQGVCKGHQTICDSVHFRFRCCASHVWRCHLQSTRQNLFEQLERKIHGSVGRRSNEKAGRTWRDGKQLADPYQGS